MPDIFLYSGEASPSDVRLRPVLAAVNQVAVSPFSIATAVYVPTVSVASGSLSAPVGLATESDTAAAVGRVKIKAVGLSTEVDASFATSRAKAKASGLSTEADTSSALSRLKSKSAGLSSEADTSLALSRVKSKAASLSAESDSAFALSKGGQAAAVGLSTESNSAYSLARIKTKAIGLSTEADSSLSVGRKKLLGLGVSVETDQAFARTLPGLMSAPVGLAVESDESFALSRLAVSQDAGGFVRVSKSDRKKTKAWLTSQRTLILPVGLASEKNKSFALDAEFPRPKWVSFTPNLEAIRPPRQYKQRSAKPQEATVDYAAIEKRRAEIRLKARRKRDEEFLLFIA